MKIVMRSVVFASALSIGFAAVAAETEPIYIFDVSSETEIDSAQVKHVTGGVTNEVAFSSLAAPTTGTIIKLGTGRLKSSATLGGFVGALLIREGEFAVDAAGELGPGNAAEPRVKVTVSDGATFVTAGTTATYGLAKNVDFTISGSGYAGKGVLREESAIAAASPYVGGSWALAADATVISKNSDRLGVPPLIDLQEHVLTFDNAYSKTDSKISFSGCTVTNAPVGVSIIANDIRVLVQGADNKLCGSAANVFKLTGAASWRGYGVHCDYIPWTIDCQENKANLIGDGYGDGKEGAVYSGLDNYYYAPFYLRGLTTVWAWRSNPRGTGVNLRGFVSGPGGFYVKEEEALMLDCPTNSFAGGIGMNATSYLDLGNNSVFPALTLRANGALPKNGGGAALTNAHLRLTADQAYELPTLSFTTKPTGGVTAWEMSGGNVGTVVKSFSKFGKGALNVTSPITVDGTIDIREGRVNMPVNPRSRPGFIFGLMDGSWDKI